MGDAPIVRHLLGIGGAIAALAAPGAAHCGADSGKDAAPLSASSAARSNVFSAEFGGYSWLRYEFQRDDLGRVTSAATVDRLKVFATGSIGREDLHYRLQWNASNASILDDAYLDWSPRSWLGIRAGREKVPFLRQWLVYGSDLALTDLAAPVDAFSLGRQVGAHFYGELAHNQFLYDVGLYDGSNFRAGRIPRSWVINVSPSLAVVRWMLNLWGRTRLVESPPGNMDGTAASFGWSGFYQGGYLSQSAVDCGLPSFQGDGGSFEFSFQSRWFSLQAEWMMETDAFQQLCSILLTQGSGFYVQASGVALPGVLELSVRFSRLDAPPITEFTSGVREIEAVATVYALGRALRAQLGYAFLQFRSNQNPALGWWSSSYLWSYPQPTGASWANQARLQLVLSY